MRVAAASMRAGRTGRLRRYQVVSIAFRRGDPFPMLRASVGTGFFSVALYGGEPPSLARPPGAQGRKAGAGSSRLALVTSW